MKLKIMYRSVIHPFATHKGFAIMPVLTCSAFELLGAVVKQAPMLHGAN